MCICDGYEQGVGEVVVELELDRAEVRVAGSVSLEGTLEDVISEGGATTRGLVWVVWDFEVQDGLEFLKGVEELIQD